MNRDDIIRAICEKADAHPDEPLGPGQVLALGMTPAGIADTIVAATGTAPEPYDALAVAISAFVTRLTGEPFRTDADEVRRYW